MKSIQLGTIKLAYQDQGTGPVVVLLHGYPLDSRMWEPQIEALSKSCRVIAPDLRGFGQSSQSSEDATNGVSMSQYAADVAELLAAISVTEPVILCGFSMGGYILWQFLRQFPERVKAIVPCDTRAIADSAEARQGRLKTAGEVMKSGVEPIITAMLPKLLSEATRHSRLDIVAALTAIMNGCSPAAIAASLRGMADRPDVTADLPKITQPALVLVGAEDVISSPDEMRGIAEKLPDAEFVEIPAAGHMTTLENPAAVNAALLDFIKRQS
ncbi:MAG: alpha/beta hydrolase [Bythopirellula sp.]|nr:alpha/beta hydrolase [Bythopirellula sp.]